MEKSVERIGRDVTEIKSALLGNPLAGDGGIVGRISKLESEIEEQKEIIQGLKDQRIRHNIYFGVIIFISSLVVAKLIDIIFPIA